MGLAIRISLMKEIPSLPVRFNEHLMKLHFPLNRIHHVTISTAYVPTLTSPDEAKEQFYEDLGHPIKGTHPSDKLIILWNFNTRVGKVNDDWKGILGPHSVRNLNSNGLLLLSKCAEHMQCITNTIFGQADKYEVTWMHPRSKPWHLNDCYCQAKRYPGHEDNPCHVECWMLVKPQSGQIYPQATHCSHTVQVFQIIRTLFIMTRLRNPYHFNRFWETLDERFKASAPMLQQALISGGSLTRLSLKQQKLSWVLRNMNIRIGLMRMMSVSLSNYMWRTRPMCRDKMA